MNLEFKWQVGNEEDQQETLADIARRRRPLVPHWVWFVVAGLVLSLGAGAYIVLRQRYEAAQERIAFQIQSVIDLEASAYARGDAELYLDQQDQGAPEWYASQAARVGADCLGDASGGSGTPGRSSPAVERYPCEPVLPAVIEDLDVQRDIAWVEVVEGQPSMRRVRFYRQTGFGWVETSPDSAFWGTAVEVRYGEDLVFRYHRRDRPYVQPAVDRMAQAFSQTCAMLGCPFEKPVEISFVVDMPRLKPPKLQDGQILLPSPWIAGIPVNGGEAPQVADYAYLLTFELVAAHLEDIAGQPLTSFQHAMAGEYAAWQSAGPGHAPLVERLVARRGTGALPAVFASLADVDSLNLLMVQWLGLSASTRPSAYFEALVNLEQQALAAGRKETFLLLQDETIPGWLEAQEAFFERSQARDLDIEPAEVESVDVSGELARVTLDRPTALAGAHPLAPQGQVVYFRRQDGDWKHTSPHFAYAEPATGNPAASSTSASQVGDGSVGAGDGLDVTALCANDIDSRWMAPID